MHERLREQFIIRRSELQSSSRSPDGIPQEEMADEVDQACAEYNCGVEAQLQERNSTQIRKINVALQKIDEGTYGTCEDCGEDINEKRLKLIPDTELCVVCAELSQRKALTERSNPKRAHWNQQEE